MRAADRVKLWNKIRAKLKVEFERMGLTTCEVCGGTFGLSFAHRYKRRFIHDEEELATVALLCQRHHEELEHSGHEKMLEGITAIIARRNVNREEA